MSATAIPTGETEAPQQEPVARTATSAKIFKYSEFVDVGEGAVECEHSRDGQCVDPAHFHAWCRLPNRFQEEDIRAKAQAAKARRIRALRDPESDLSVVLDSTLDALRDERHRDQLVEELVKEDLAGDYMEAQTDTLEREEFEHYEQDREEYDRLFQAEGELPEDEQSDEYKRLREHIAAFLKAINGRLAEIQAPKKEDLAQRPYELLFEELRSKKVAEESSRAFIDTYNAWSIFVGTFHPELHATLCKPYRPRWDEIGHRDRPVVGTMFAEEQESLDALEQVYRDLRVAFREGSKGN